LRLRRMTRVLIFREFLHQASFPLISQLVNGPVRAASERNQRRI
jgi:hypothetical protein